MTQKKYQVFISSTFEDLLAERAEIAKAVLRILFFIALACLTPSVSDAHTNSVLGERREVIEHQDLVERQANACRFFFKNSSQNSIAIINNFVCFQGRLTESSTRELSDIFQKSNQDTLVIKSLGGDAFGSMGLGFILAANNINIIAVDYCASACSGYLFMAAHEKNVAKNSILLWHSLNLVSMEAPRLPRIETKSPAILMLYREFDFFDRFKYAYDSMTIQMPSGEESARWQSLVRKIKARPFSGLESGWTFSLSALEKLGVPGLRSIWFPDSVSLAETLAARAYIQNLFIFE